MVIARVALNPAPGESRSPGQGGATSLFVAPQRIDQGRTTVT